jgi:hypothetical protein
VHAPTLVTSPSADAYLIPVPDAAPPYDCDIHGTACQTPSGPGAAGSTLGPGIGGSTLGGPAGGEFAAADVAALGAKPVTPSPLASCVGAAWPRQFAQAIVETLAGTRPMRQLVPWTTERAQAHIRTLCPLFRSGSGPRIQRVLSSSPSANVMEVTVIAGFGPRTRALAMRFEHVAARQPAPGVPGRPTRWLCTDIETG